MNPITITFIILGGSILIFLSGRLRPDLVALLVAISLGVTGILTPQEVFSGFSRSAVITIMAIYVLAEGLLRTGVTDQVGAFLLRVGGMTERWLMGVVMFAGAFLSLFMNNIAAASVMLPAIAGVARKSRVNPSHLLMPLAFGTILGGMATLLTTTNIVVSSLLRDEGLVGYGLLDFAPLGLPLVAAGVIYMAFVGQRLLPAKSNLQRWRTIFPQESNLTSIYQLEERLIRARVPAGSNLIGKTLSQSNLRQDFRLNLVSIERIAQTIISPSPDTTFKQDDILLLEGKLEKFSKEALRPTLELLPTNDAKSPDLKTQKLILVEAVLAPRSILIGKTLRSTHFREKYDLNVIAIWRSGRPIRTSLSDLPLQFGDALLVQGQRERVSTLHSEPDLIILNGEERLINVKGRKIWPALFIMGTALMLTALNLIPAGEAMLGGALAMVLVGILTMDRVYQVIDWRSIFLIAGMLPLGIAMTKTGAASYLGNGMVTFLGPAGPMALLAGMVVLAMLLSQVINGAVVATLVAPIAIGIARQIGVDPRAMAMGVALATSMTFLSPLGHPVNVLVMGPGGYSFQDYFKVGLPLTLLLLVLMMALFPVLWPLTAK
ncbi:MAG TPA: SLC13 family permease [Anaerolineales bacterium]|nr:SLC13 family permease [Anaerolineales bacterium]